MTRMAVVIMVAALAAAPLSAWAGHEAKHSGRIAAVSLDGTTLTLEEMGPWHGQGTALARRSIQLKPTTRVELAARAGNKTPSGWPGGFTDRPVDRKDLHVGDFATVVTDDNHGHLSAESITVIRPAASPAVTAAQSASLSRPR